MKDKYDVTEAELEIMQVLWEEECELEHIIEILNHKEERNKNTIKTLLRRLILKGAVKSKKQGTKTIYVPTIRKEKFLENQNEQFINRLYNGNPEKLVLNFVENKKISKQELQKLMDILEDEEG